MRATAALSALALLVTLNVTSAVAADDEVVMYKNPQCGCCGKWADHLRANGFSVREVGVSDLQERKRAAGVPESLGSCHTALVDGYVVEGHVPASDVRRLLSERPALAGIAVPGMPLGSPGMEGPYPAERYEVIGFDGDGQSLIFSRH